MFKFISKTNSNSSLFEAIESGDINSVKEALQQGVDPNRKNSHGTPPLCLAAHNGHIEITTLLLDSGANPDLQDNDDWAPIHEASTNGHKEIVTLLLDRGANPDLQNDDDWASLHLAVHNGHIEITTLLLDRGANPDLQDNDKCAPLHLAAKYDHKEIVTLLLDRGANPDLQNNDAESLLRWASKNGHREIVTRLLEKSANPDLQDSCGWAPLHWATHNGHKEIVTLLLDRGANPDLQSNDGRAPLHLASEGGDKEIVTLLLEEGANPDLQDNDDWAPLHLAARYGHKEIITLLLEKGANPDLQNNDGRAPLHLASEDDDKEILALLSDKKTYSAQRLKLNKIITGRAYHPSLTYQEAKFFVEHLAVMSLWGACKDIYATDENTTVDSSLWFELPVDIRKVIIGFLAGGERTTKQLDDLYKKMTTDWVGEELSAIAFRSKKRFVETLFTDYLKTSGKFHTETANSFINKGLRTVTAIEGLKENTNTFYQTFNGAPQITGTRKAFTNLFSRTKNETAESNNNTIKQAEQPQDKWRQQRTSYDPKGGFFRIAVTAQHKVNGIKSLTLKDDKGKEFTPPTPKG